MLGHKIYFVRFEMLKRRICGINRHETSRLLKVNVNRTCIYCVLFVCFQFNFSRFEGFLCSLFTSIHIIKKGKKSNDAILEQCQGGFDLKIPSLSLQTEQQKRGKFCKCPCIIQLKICPNGPLPAFEYN